MPDETTKHDEYDSVARVHAVAVSEWPWLEGDIAMQNLLDTIGKLIGTSWKHRETKARHSRAFVCRCGRHVFFGNTLCLGCNAPLGYLPHDARADGPEAEVHDPDRALLCCHFLIS